jgi:hypothetical protein
LCLLLAWPACDGDSKKTQASITGRWEIFQGFRNRRQTETLQGVFFQFNPDGTMFTNLPVGADAPTQYELNKNEIRQKSPQEVIYTIQSANDTLLVLAMEMRGVEFELHLRKAPSVADPVESDSLTPESGPEYQPSGDGLSR